MASTKTLQDTITWATTIIKGQSLNVTNMEPGLTFGNLVLGRVLGPPMKWRFNRGSLSFGISTAGGTDYAQTAPLLGWIEEQWLMDATGTIHALEGKQSLPKTTNSYRPKTIAPEYDNNTGNITFRLDAIPTANDTVFVDYQQKAPLMTSYASSWAPIPDEYGYIYNKLYLALAGNLVGDARAPQWSAEGVSALLGAQKGLTAQERAIFLMQWDREMQTLATSQDMGKLGVQGLAR
jgi:hypothetical protein